MINILFVDSYNKRRGPTAVSVYEKHPHYIAKSIGIEESGLTEHLEEMLDKADIVFVMQPLHQEFLSLHYAKMLEEKEIVVLEIDEEYEYLDAMLVEIIKERAGEYL